MDFLGRPAPRPLIRELEARIGKTHESFQVEIDSNGYYDQCWWTLENETSLTAPSKTASVYSEAEAGFATAVFALFSVVGAVLNFLMIIAIVKNQKFRKEYLTPTLVSILVTDFVFSIYYLPIVSSSYYIRDMPVSCGSFAYIAIVLFMTSALNLLGIAILRCFLVFFPWKLDDPIFKYGSKIIPLAGWVLSLLMFSPTLSDNNGQFALECQSMICRWISKDSDGNPTGYDPEVSGQLAIILVAFVIVVLNLATYIKVSRDSKDMSREVKNINPELAKKFLERERRLGKSIGLLTGLFFLVYFPGIVLRKYDSNARITRTTLTIVCSIINWSIGIIDPLVYLTRRKKYRDSVKNLILFKETGTAFDERSTRSTRTTKGFSTSRAKSTHIRLTEINSRASIQVSEDCEKPK